MSSTSGHAVERHRIVIELSSDGAERWEGVLNNVENSRQALSGETELEVVTHGKGLGLVLATNTAMAERVEKLAGAGVVFAACENTMKRLGVDRTQLMPVAITVDSGVAEVVRKQEAGWSYLKGGG